MRALALEKFGGPEALKIQDLPIPEIAAEEILIRVEAAGVSTGRLDNGRQRADES